MKITYKQFQEYVRDIYFSIEEKEHDKELYVILLKCLEYERKRAIILLQEYCASNRCSTEHVARVQTIIKFLQERIED